MPISVLSAPGSGGASNTRVSFEDNEQDADHPFSCAGVVLFLPGHPHLRMARVPASEPDRRPHRDFFVGPAIVARCLSSGFNFAVGYFSVVGLAVLGPRGNSPPCAFWRLCEPLHTGGRIQPLDRDSGKSGGRHATRIAAPRFDSAVVQRQEPVWRSP